MSPARREWERWQSILTADYVPNPLTQRGLMAWRLAKHHYNWTGNEPVSCRVCTTQLRLSEARLETARRKCASRGY